MKIGEVERESLHEDTGGREPLRGIKMREGRESHREAAKTQEGREGVGGREREKWKAQVRLGQPG